MSKIHKQLIKVSVHGQPYQMAVTFESTSQREEALKVLKSMVEKAEKKYQDPRNDLTDTRAAMEIGFPAQEAVNEIAGRKLNRLAHDEMSFTSLVK